jgi:hypothetical protein
MAKKVATRRRTPRGLAHTDTAALRRELERRAGLLVARREQLLAELSELDAELQALGVAGASRPGPRRRRYARNKMTLVEALRAALKGKTMSAGDAIAAIAAAGYKSTSRTLTIQVRNALAKAEHFKRVERGRYTAK